MEFIFVLLCKYYISEKIINSYFYMQNLLHKIYHSIIGIPFEYLLTIISSRRRLVERNVVRKS